MRQPVPMRTHAASCSVDVRAKDAPRSALICRRQRARRSCDRRGDIGTSFCGTTDTGDDLRSSANINDYHDHWKKSSDRSKNDEITAKIKAPPKKCFKCPIFQTDIRKYMISSKCTRFSAGAKIFTCALFIRIMQFNPLRKPGLKR